MSAYSEPSEKIAKKIARAKVRHMSDTKWRKLFTLLHDLPGGCETMGLKLIGQKVMGVPPPGPSFEQDSHFAPRVGLSDVPFVYIDYVGLSNRVVGNAELVAYLERYGQWPIVEEDEGILVIGYEWG